MASTMAASLSAEKAYGMLMATKNMPAMAITIATRSSPSSAFAWLPSHV